MTTKELIDKLSTYPDDTPVLIPIVGWVVNTTSPTIKERRMSWKPIFTDGKECWWKDDKDGKVAVLITDGE